MSVPGRIGFIVALVVLLNTPFMSACTVPPRVLSMLFENVPPPGEEKPPAAVVRQPRRTPYKPPPKPVAIEIPDEPERPDLHAQYALLPRNAEGQVMWARALDEKLVSPKPGIEADVADPDQLDLDIELIPKDQADFKVVFPHKSHTMWLACVSCHTAIFEMERGKTAITMDRINNGELCGVCHTRVAAPELSACPACHRAMPK